MSSEVGSRAVSFTDIPSSTGHRVVIYGPGGIGKTTFASVAPGPVAVFDLDESLPRLRESFVKQKLTVKRVVCDDWQMMRESLRGGGWDGIKSIVIDSATKAQELALAYTIATVPHEKGTRIRSIEDYGYGKGYTHLYDTFLCLLSDLDIHYRAGRNVILVCHECREKVPNPAGEDWLRYEPRLESPSSGKSSIRLRVKEWSDHVLFVGYDVDVTDGKGKGCGSRTLYPTELPHCMAKSRSLEMPMVLNRFDRSIWEALLK